MKSQVNTLLHVVGGLLEDARRAYPALKGLDLDMKRLTLLCQTRGLGLFTLDLPNLESQLLAGLETGRLIASGPSSRKVSTRCKVPILFSGLWLRIFDINACLKQDADVTAIAFLRQLLVIGKKLEVECSADRRMTALRSYHDVERSLRAPTLQWDSDRLALGESRSRHLDDYASHCAAGPFFGYESDFEFDRKDLARDQELLRRVQRVADILSTDLGFFEPVTFSSERADREAGLGFKHGPGAVAERCKQWEKSHFPNWPHKLGEWFPFADVAKCASDTRDSPLNHELASRLICVPKTSKGPRLIAAEPIAHQWCQQATWSWLRDRIRSSLSGLFIDFSDQAASGDMVLQASLDRKLATVDLSDASDRLTCWTVERVFRENPSLLSALHAARTRYLRDDISGVQSSFIKLNKFASQGTAVTFPVQSLVFLAIALASCEDRQLKDKDDIRRLRGRVRVFGDDIIIPRHGYARLVRVMNCLQLKVNLAKSYVHGHFRESCGTDGYKGVNVTPAKPRTLDARGPQSIQALIDVSNNLFSKGYWVASKRVQELIPNEIRTKLRIIPEEAVRLHRDFPEATDGCTGLSSFCGASETHLKSRWNRSLQRLEVRVARLSPGKLQKKTRDGFAPLLDFFASPLPMENLGVRTPRITSEVVCRRTVRMGRAWEPHTTQTYSVQQLRVVEHGLRSVSMAR